MSSAEVEGAPAGDTGGTAIEVAVGKRGRQTSAERSKKARLKKNGAAGGAAAPKRRGTAGGGAALPQASGPVVSDLTAQLPCDPPSPPADDSAHDNTAADGMAAADKYVSPAKKFWSGGQGIRLVLCALEDCMVRPMERLGTQSDRLETQVSCASNPQGPDDHFFEVLTHVSSTVMYNKTVGKESAINL
jgi:hypothetical protein